MFGSWRWGPGRAVASNFCISFKENILISMMEDKEGDDDYDITIIGPETDKEKANFEEVGELLVNAGSEGPNPPNK